MNTLMQGLKTNNNLVPTQNGGRTHRTTNSDVLDLFAMGGAYRNRSDDDVLNLFVKAYREDKLLALKCLFYLRDIRGGQGERRFFRKCIEWLADKDKSVMSKNLINVPKFGRWDDLYSLFGTQLKSSTLNFMKQQLTEDLKSEHPSLLAKWMKSENASSNSSKRLAKETRDYWHWGAKQYRSALSSLRRKIDIVERKMSNDEWPEIKYETVPSKAGLQYRKAFYRHDEARYSAFVNDKTKKVKAGALYPYEVVSKAISFVPRYDNNVEREAINKFWDNLTNYFDKATFNGIAMVDTSGSMTWAARSSVKPIDVAVSLGMYLAERAHGPFQNHYISFSSRPQLIEINGYDFVDKVKRIVATNLCQNTNIEAAFDMLLKTAKQYHVPDKDMPKNIIVISDMEFDAGSRDYRSGFCDSDATSCWDKAHISTTMENIADKWVEQGYTLPNLIYWNVNAMQDNIPMTGSRVSFVSGFSPSIFETIMTGKTGYELMLDKLNSERYESVTV